MKLQEMKFILVYKNIFLFAHFLKKNFRFRIIDYEFRENQYIIRNWCEK